MKTILSILEVLVYNLFPPAFAAQMVTIFNDVVPLVGVAFIRMGLYLITRLHHLKKNILQQPQAKLFRFNNVFPIHERIKRSRA